MDSRIKFVLWAEDVREYCIRNNYYTLGTNEEYDHLLCDLVWAEGESITPEQLWEIASDIEAHSEHNPMGYLWEETAEERVRFICRDLMRYMRIA